MFIFISSGFHSNHYLCNHTPTDLQLLIDSFRQQIFVNICYVLGNVASLFLLV